MSAGAARVVVRAPRAATSFGVGVRRRARRRTIAVGALVIAAAALFVVALVFGERVYSLSDVARVIAGQTVPGASFTVGELRLPRASAALLSGAAFGLGGVTFQTMLRNPLASPDIIGINWGASAAAVVAAVVLRLDSGWVSLVAIVAALIVAGSIYLLAYRDGVAGSRLILIGIGIAAMLQSVIAYVLIRASSWDVQTAMRWLTGSLNGVAWEQVVPLALAVAVGGPLLAWQGRRIELLQHGDDAAAALGVPVERTRLISILVAVGLVAFATGAVGPVAFVAFLAGPIALGIVGPGRPLLIPAALTGAVLVLGADLLGQFAFDSRYPVGVITGVLGAPYLVFLLIRTNRRGVAL